MRFQLTFSLSVIADTPSSTPRSLVVLPSLACTPVHVLHQRAATREPLINATKRPLALLAPSSRPNRVCAARIRRSRTSGVPRRKSPADSNVARSWDAATTDAKRTVIRLANAKTANRHAANRRRSAVTHAQRRVMRLESAQRTKRVKLSSRSAVLVVMFNKGQTVGRAQIRLKERAARKSAEKRLG